MDRPPCLLWFFSAHCPALPYVPYGQQLRLLQAAAGGRRLRRSGGQVGGSCGRRSLNLPPAHVPALGQAVAERLGVQGGGTNADPGATGERAPTVPPAAAVLSVEPLPVPLLRLPFTAVLCPPACPGRGGANTMTDPALRHAGGQAAGAGMRTGFGGTTTDTAAAGGPQMHPSGAQTGFGGTTAEVVGAGGPQMRTTAASSGFGGTTGTLDQPATGPMGGGRGMGEPMGGAAAGPGAAGTTFTGQGRTGDAAMGGGVMDPTPVDRKSGM